MDLGLKGKRALVTGASKGIGVAVGRSRVFDIVGGPIWANDAGARFHAWDAGKTAFQP
jgi:hypothetical protein